VCAAPCRRCDGEHASQDHQGRRSCEDHALTPFLATSLSLSFLRCTRETFGFNERGLAYELCRQ
jgi:hypothetical protein